MIKLYVDAATKGNPGPSGIGILIVENKKQLSYKIPIGIMSNHEAEFHAAIEGLRKIQKSKKNEFIYLYTDSKLVVESVKKKKTNQPTFQPLLFRLLFLVDSFPNLQIIWQSDKNHQGAHTLAQQALHLQDSF